VKDFNINEAQVAEVRHIQTVSLTIMVVRTKYGKVASFKVSVLEKLNNLVYERPPSDEIKAALLKAKVNIICDAI
jgi:DeoR/GlpR family transcriptional regulator of sugar metabolism